MAHAGRQSDLATLHAVGERQKRLAPVILGLYGLAQAFSLALGTAGLAVSMENRNKLLAVNDRLLNVVDQLQEDFKTAQRQFEVFRTSASSTNYKFTNLEILNRIYHELSIYRLDIDELSTIVDAAGQGIFHSKLLNTLVKSLGKSLKAIFDVEHLASFNVDLLLDTTNLQLAHCEIVEASASKITFQVGIPALARDQSKRFKLYSRIPTPIIKDGLTVNLVDQFSVLAISLDKKRFAVMTETDLEACNYYPRKGHRTCPHMNILARQDPEIHNRPNEAQCLFELHLNDNPKAISTFCDFQVVKSEPVVYKISFNEFFLFTPHSMTIPLDCKHKNGDKIKFVGGRTTQFKINTGCSFVVGEETFMAYPAAKMIDFDFQYSSVHMHKSGNFSLNLDFDPVEIEEKLNNLAQNQTKAFPLNNLLETLRKEKQNAGHIWGFSALQHAFNWGIGAMFIIQNIVILIGGIIYHCWISRNFHRGVVSQTNQIPLTQLVAPVPQVAVQSSFNPKNYPQF